MSGAQKNREEAGNGQDHSRLERLHGDIQNYLFFSLRKTKNKVLIYTLKNLLNEKHKDILEVK